MSATPLVRFSSQCTRCMPSRGVLSSPIVDPIAASGILPDERACELMTRMGRGKQMPLALLMAVAAVAGGERTAAAQSTAAKATPRVVLAETTSIEARLDAVDVKTRRMMVTGPRGKTLTLKVGPDAVSYTHLRAHET